MKKISKSLAFLLSLVMLLSVVSVPAMADDVPATTIQPLDDVNIGRGSTPPINLAGVNKIRLFNIDGNTSWGSTAIGAFAYDVSEVFATLAQNPDYVVDSVKFVPTATKDEGDTTSMTLEFCPISVKWSSSDKEGYTTITTANRGTIIPFSGTGTEFTAETLSLECKTNPISGQFDITPLFKKHMTNNQGTDLQNFFSFALKMKDTNGGNEAQDIASLESGDGAEIVVTYVKPEALSLTEYKLPTQPKDEVVLTQNKYIASVSAKVNGADVDAQYINITNSTVTIDYPFGRKSDYTIEVVTIDEYGKSDTFTDSFTTTYNTESVNASFVSTHDVETSQSTSVSANFSRFGGSTWGEGVIVYGFTIPEKPSNGYIEKAEFTFWLKEPAPALVYEFITDSAISTLCLADAKAIMTTDARLTESAQKSGEFSDAYSTTWTQYKADVSSYLNKLYSLNKTGTAYIAVACNSVGNASRHSRTNTSAAITCTINEQPAIEVTDSSCTVTGSVIRELAVELPTVFDSEVLLSNLVLRDSATKEAADVSFKYDPSSRKITLAETATLAENKVYELVINEGTADLYGNTVPADGLILIDNITTGANTVATAPILVAASTEIKTDGTTDFASLTPLTEVADAKAVAKVSNYRTTSTTVRIAAAAYAANGELLSIEINDQWIRQGSTFTIASPAISADGAATIKAFVWDYYDQVTPFAVSCTIGAAR